MDGHVRGDAVGVDGGVADLLGALRDLELGAGVAADSGVEVPEAAGLGGRVEVVLDEDRARGRALGRDDELGELDAARGARLGADLEDGLRRGHVLEGSAAAHDHRVTLSHNAGTGGDEDGVRNHVQTVVEEDNLSA